MRRPRLGEAAGTPSMASAAAPGSPQRQSPWNPLRCGSTPLPQQILLAAKLVAVFLLAHSIERYGNAFPFGSHSLSPDPASALEALGYAARGLSVVFALLLLFNVGVRWMCAALGLVVVVGFALNGGDYGELFAGAFLLLAAFEVHGREPSRLRCGVVALQAAAGVGWLWSRSWGPLWSAFTGREPAASVVPSESVLAFNGALPPGWMPLATGGAMALISFAIAAGLLSRRFFPLAIWAALVLHCAWALGVVPAGAMSYAVLACYLVFAAWPTAPLVVIYDGECGFCNLSRQWVSRADFDRIYDWRPFQSGVGAAYGIPTPALEEKVHAIAAGRVYAGFRAFRAMTLFNPAVYLTAAVVLAALGVWAPAWRDGLFAALVVLFSPLAYPLGEAAYNWVARNRHLMPPYRCKAPE